ncbi:MAG: hypothetical protein ABH832_03655 [bacterium]
MIKLNFIHICESVIEAVNRNISIIGIFNKITSLKLPVLYPKFSIITSISAPPGSYKEVIEIVSPEGQTVARLEGKVQIYKEGQKGNFVANFINTLFPIEGKYQIKISVNNELLDDQNFIILTT